MDLAISYVLKHPMIMVSGVFFLIAAGLAVTRHPREAGRVAAVGGVLLVLGAII